MNRNRLMTMLLLMFFISIAANAQNAVAIHQQDGQVAIFAISEKPVVTYSGSDLVLTTKNNTMMYPIYMLKKISFDVELFSSSAIEDVEMKTNAQFSFQGGTLDISGATPGSLVLIYNINGFQIGKYKLDDRGCTSIPLQQLDMGVYIVKTNDFTFKFLKR